MLKPDAGGVSWLRETRRNLLRIASSASPATLFLIIDLLYAPNFSLPLSTTSLSSLPWFSLSLHAAAGMRRAGGARLGGRPFQHSAAAHQVPLTVTLLLLLPLLVAVSAATATLGEHGRSK